MKRASSKSIIVRAAPDFFIDILGERKYLEKLDFGSAFTFDGVRIVPDETLKEGTCLASWMQ